jgi:hypothetical protein
VKTLKPHFRPCDLYRWAKQLRLII